MKLSAPIFRLKRQARLLSREAQIPLHQALDQVALEEGYESWSLLAARYSAPTTGKRLIDVCRRGDLVLLGARPGHGKTLLALEAAVAAMHGGGRSYFFSLEYGLEDIRKTFRAIGEEMSAFEDRFAFDCSDDICASYIIEQLQEASTGTVVIVDYLQLLDQKRQHPELSAQIADLKAFAVERGLILLFVSQIHRDFDSTHSSVPRLADVRLPNPLDLEMFSRTCFLHEGEIELADVASTT
jgi:replicative DNA helicase